MPGAQGARGWGEGVGSGGGTGFEAGVGHRGPHGPALRGWILIQYRSRGGTRCFQQENEMIILGF